MEAKGFAMLRVLINHYHKGSAEALLNCLPQEKVQKILSQDVQSQDAHLAVAKPEESLKKIHYSWFVEPIQKMSASLQQYVLAALPDYQSAGISRILHTQPKKMALSQPVKEFFLNILYSSLHVESIIPDAYLPKSPLQPLTKMSKQDLVELIDLLAMHDLVHEVRHIVDKTRLKSIYGALTKRQQQYLRQVLHQQDKISVPKLGLDRWDGDAKNLEAIIHRRGMMRLGKALSGQHPDLVWHVFHHLDTGRSTILNKNYTKEEIPIVSASVVPQVVNAMNFLKQTTKETA